MEKIKDIYMIDNQIMSDAFDRTVAEIHIMKQQNGYETFLITGCEPGVGTTTIAINLATTLSSAGWKTLLIDADMRKRFVDKRLTENTSLGLSNYLLQNVDLNQVVLHTNIDNLSYVSSGDNVGNTISMICSIKMNSMLHKFKKQYDYVIIDMPAMTAAIDASVMATLVDGVVLVTARGKATKHHIAEAVDQLDKVSANVLGIIVNRVDKDEYKRVMRDYDYFKNRKYKHKRKEKRAR